MKVCFPVAEVNGIASEVYGHFGSAPVADIKRSDYGNTCLLIVRAYFHCIRQKRVCKEILP